MADSCFCQNNTGMRHSQKGFGRYSRLKTGSSGKLEETRGLIAQWIKLHGYTPRVEEMRNRQALLEEADHEVRLRGGRRGVGRGISPFELGYYGVDPGEAQARYLEGYQVVMQALAAARTDAAVALQQAEAALAAVGGDVEIGPATVIAGSASLTGGQVNFDGNTHGYAFGHRERHALPAAVGPRLAACGQQALPDGARLHWCPARRVPLLPLASRPPRSCRRAEWRETGPWHCGGWG